ncbi:hypothetical protein P154DRAFT_571621 [Amniculicola lignicola CBS 123094]|uniref:DUF7918 domain-containing protein n=1 Tax=Amniculicola lignicola CBS 123094 TaxID=1392246 RepID=A0A6A5WVV1_9PLEO|nr:hypothetical protein P154DRAFT_571621 [Amniculicola lignicola CBS 123094]
MAILSEVPGLEAAILVKGKKVQEYDDWVHQNQKQVSKYVEAQSAEEFEVHYEFKQPFPDDRPISTKIFLDGVMIDEPLLRPNEIYAKEEHLIAGPVSRFGTGWIVEKFRFAEVSLEEGDRQLGEDELEALKAAGTIELQFFWLKNLKINRRGFVKRGTLKQMDKVPEKAVKGQALSHQALLSKAKDTKPVEFVAAKYAEKDPFATFIFKYRSFAALKALYVIPRTPTPVPLSQREMNEMNDDEVRAELRRPKARKSANAKVWCANQA